MSDFIKNCEEKIDRFIKLIYQETKSFPKEETYNMTSQLRRASVSVMLNYVEGYARFKTKVYLNFLETSYGSLKESMYLVRLGRDLNYINDDNYQKIFDLGDEIGKMLYHTINIKRDDVENSN